MVKMTKKSLKNKKSMKKVMTKKNMKGKKKMVQKGGNCGAGVCPLQL